VRRSLRRRRGARCGTSTGGNPWHRFDGEPLVTDGPYTEGVEQLGGFYLVEADSHDQVLDLCRLLPTSYAVEVRPVIEIEGYEGDRDWA
jgi:hypothetical protein